MKNHKIIYNSEYDENFNTENPTPIFSHSVNIVFSVDKNYIPYLSVTIASIIATSSSSNHYDIIILYSNLDEYQKRFILSLRENHTNVSVRFFNMQRYIERYNLDKLFVINHLSISAYYRIFIGKIFCQYDKVIYLDCDLVVTRDIAELFSLDIKHYPLAAVPDTLISNSLLIAGFTLKSWDNFKQYMYKTFHYTNHDNYFNSGVLVVDIDKFNHIGFEHLLDIAQRNNRYYHDQNVLNVAFENNYYQLPTTWNYQWYIKFYSRDKKQYQQVLSADTLALYEDYRITPAVIHYTSAVKPWKNAHHTFANIWWEYARKSPFYEIILHEFLKENQANHQPSEKNNMELILLIMNYRKNRFRYHRYKILSKISFGKMRQKYQKKRDAYKKLVRKVRDYFYMKKHGKA